MATQGSYNGHERNETEGTVMQEKGGHRVQEYRSNNHRGNGDNRGYRNTEKKGRNNEYKSKENRSGGDRPRENRGSFGGYRTYGKEEEENRTARVPKQRSTEKVREPQPDKFETIKRLEREQKTIRKKESKRGKAESNRPQQKQKRQNNRNYLTDYANGMYDDYEDDF